MAVFVDLGDEDNAPPQDGQPPWTGRVDPEKPVPASAATRDGPGPATANNADMMAKTPPGAHGLAVRDNPNRNSMTLALGCYP